MFLGESNSTSAIFIAVFVCVSECVCVSELFMLLFIYLCYCCIYCIYIDALATLCYAVMLIKLI